MWEHRSISDEYLRQHRRIQATETYVELMGQVERAVSSLNHMLLMTKISFNIFLVQDLGLLRWIQT